MKPLRSVVSLLLAALAVFAASRALIRALPGDPLETLIAETGTSIPHEELRAELGLDRPFLPALAHDLRRAVSGDLGRSIVSREPVAPLLAWRFSHTLGLAALALALGGALSIALGLAAAAAPGGRADRACSVYGALAAALPAAWTGPALLYLLAVKARLLPVGGHVLLPALTLAFGLSGLWSRLVRERARETLRSDAATAARARGVPERTIALKYGFAPASPALAAYFGTQAGALLSGAFVMEVVFDWPGLGSLLVDSVLRRDYPVLEAAVFVTSFFAIAGTRLGDWAQRRIDPRLRA